MAAVHTGTTSTTAAGRRPGILDKLGIPHVLRWGFLGVLVFMTGHGVESNFVQPHIATAVGDRQVASTIIAVYGISVIIASYLSGALSDLWGPRKVMLLGFCVWMVFEAAFLASLATGSTPAVLVSYFLRGFGYPLFAFAFLVWINSVVDKRRNGTAVGWFYVVFTGGLPTLGSLYAVVTIPLFGGGYTGETGAMVSSVVLVVAGFLIAWFGIKEPRGRSRLVKAGTSDSSVILSGLRICVKEPRVFIGFIVRLINTSPEFGMFIVLPTVIGTQLGYGQSKWLVMTVCVYAGNILFNAFYGAIGDAIGWVRTVRWFGIVGAAVGLLAWWYVPHWVPNNTWGYLASIAAGVVFGIMLAGFTPMGAIMPNLVPDNKGAAMAMYTTAAGGAALSGAAVVAVVRALGGSNEAVVWTFVGLYAVGFYLVGKLKVPQDEAGARAH